MSDLSPLGLPGAEYEDFDRSDSVTVTLDGVSANANRGNLLKARVTGPYSDLSPSGLPGGRYIFDNKLTLELDGTEAVTAVGDFTVTGGAVDTLTGPGLTATLGSLTAHIPVSVTLSGIEGTGTLGSLALSTAAIQSLSGTVGTTSLGTVVKADGVAITANGATSGLGDFTVTTAQILSLTGVEATGAVGTATPATEQTIALSGLAGTSGPGSLTATIPEAQRENVSDLSPLGVPGGTYNFAAEAEEVTATLTGVGATGAVAVFDGLTLIQVPDGVTATGAAGATSERTEQAITLTGEAATGQAGSFVLPQSVALEGVQGQTLLGGLTVQALDVSAPLNSVGATGSAGSITATAGLRVVPQGVASTGAAGDFTVDAVVKSASVTADLSETTLAGGVITITLANETWVSSFSAQRQNILDGITGTYFDAVIAAQPVSSVVRTSDSVVTITLQAVDYEIDADEIVAVTVPGTAVTGGISLNAGAFTVLDTRRRAGRSRKTRYIIEVDGQRLEVSSLSQAQSVLQQAAELAEQAAPQDIRRAGTRVKPPRVAVKTASGNKTTSKVLTAAVEDTQSAINTTYRKAYDSVAIEKEIADLLHRKIRDEVDDNDDEEAVALLLMYG